MHSKGGLAGFGSDAPPVPTRGAVHGKDRGGKKRKRGRGKKKGRK